MKNCGCILNTIARILVLIGALNWGLVGAGMLMGSNWNLVNMIFGSMPKLEAIIYLLVGISALVKIIGCKCAKCKACAAGAADATAPKA